MAFLSAAQAPFVATSPGAAALHRGHKAYDATPQLASAAFGTSAVHATAMLATSALGAFAASIGRRSHRRLHGACPASATACRAVATESTKETATEQDEAPTKRKAISVARDMRDEAELNRYIVTFAAAEEAAWRPARIVSVEQGEKGCLVTVEVEASREFVSLGRAYRTPGQKAQVRFDGEDGSEEVLHVASPPFSLSSNQGSLWRLKGDIYAGETKKEAAPEELRVTIDVWRPSSAPAKTLKPGDAVELGPFTEDGIELRPLLGRFQCPALAVFCDGSPEAVCHLRAALEADDCACELQPLARSALLFYCGPAPGLPETLTAWLASTPGRFQLAGASEFGQDPQQSWSSSISPTIKQLAEMGEALGALVLGSPSFVETMTSRLAGEGVKLVATSAQRQSLARVVEPEQI